MDYRGHPVLVVDDEVENLDAFTLNFGRKFTLRTAASGPEALEIARREPIAVVVADQRMPGMTGTDLLKEIRKERPDAVRMILTGYTDLESVIASINDGRIHRYITKPWDARDLETVIRNAIDHFRKGVERKRRFRELTAYNRILGLIAADRSLSRIVKEVLEVASLEFGFARTFLLLGEPSESAPLRGQAVLTGPDGKAEIRRIAAMARGADAPLGQVVGASDGFSAEKFTFAADDLTGGAPATVEFACGPFYGAPLVVDSRVVGLLCADRGAGQRTDRDDARFVATLAKQIAVATGDRLVREGLQRTGGESGATPEVESSRPTRDPTRPRSGKITDYRDYPLLVVDDDPASLETFRLNFGSAFTVVTAGSAAEGLQILEKNAMAVILSDQRMPATDGDPRGESAAFAGMSGIEFLAEARDRDPDCVRMVLTGYGDIEEIIGAVNRGLVYRYITKPWEAREVGAALKNAIEYHHEVAESRRLLREAEVLNRIMTVVSAQTDPSIVADSALRIVHADLAYDRVYLFEYDEPSGHLVRGRAVVREGESLPAGLEKMRIPVLAGGGLFANAILAGGMVRSSDGPHVPGGVEIAVKSRKATLAVPIGPVARPLGVLAAEYDAENPREFRPSDELTLVTVAEVLAVAFRHAGRLAELARRSGRAEGGAT